MLRHSPGPIQHLKLPMVLQVLLFQKKQDEMQSRLSAVEKQLQEVSLSESGLLSSLRAALPPCTAALYWGG